MTKQPSIYDRIFGFLALVCFVVMAVGMHKYGYKEGEYIYLYDWSPCLTEIIVVVSMFLLLFYNFLLLLGIKVPLLSISGVILVIFAIVLLKFTTSVICPGNINNISFVSGLIFFVSSFTGFAKTE